MSDDEEPITTATAPFDNPDGDIILRSTTDRVDFHTFKFILSLMSPVIPVAESSATLESLLLHYHPAATPKAFSSFSHAVAVMQAAKKYDMQVVFSRAVDRVFTQFIPDHVLELYALFCQFGWQDHAQMAATRALEIKDLGRPSHVFKGMRNITAFDYHRLLAYHQECGAAAQQVAKSLSSHNACHMLRCTESHDEFDDDFWGRRVCPPLVGLDEYIDFNIKAIGGTKCRVCKYKFVEGIDGFRVSVGEIGGC